MFAYALNMDLFMNFETDYINLILVLIFAPVVWLVWGSNKPKLLFWERNIPKWLVPLWLGLLIWVPVLKMKLTHRR